MNKRIYLFLLMSCLVTMMCRCNYNNDPEFNLTFTDGSVTSCYRYTEADFLKPAEQGVEMVYCKFSCPNDDSVTEALFTRGEFDTFVKTPDRTTLDARVCNAALPAPASSNEESNPVATEPPTATSTVPPTSTSTASPAPEVSLKPYLTGSFTTCDSTTRYVNFIIAGDAPAYDPATFRLLFNGQQAQCAPVNDSDPRVLSCIYPPKPNNPPASIQVFIGTQQVNDFKFEGGVVCDPVHNNPNSDPTDPPAVVPASTP